MKTAAQTILLLIALLPVANALPSFTNIQPSDGGATNSTALSYTMNEDLDYGYITWQQTGGTSDPVIHVQSLENTELLTGTFIGVLANYPLLIDGAIYSISFNGGNGNGDALTATVTDVLYDTTAPHAISVTASPNTGSVYNTESVTITIVLDENATVSGTVNGENVTWNSNGTYATALYTIHSDSIFHSMNNLPISVVVTNRVGQNTTITAFTDSTPAILPMNRPSSGGGGGRRSSGGGGGGSIAPSTPSAASTTTASGSSDGSVASEPETPNQEPVFTVPKANPTKLIAQTNTTNNTSTVSNAFTGYTITESDAAPQTGVWLLVVIFIAALIGFILYQRGRP